MHVTAADGPAVVRVAPEAAPERAVGALRRRDNQCSHLSSETSSSTSSKVFAQTAHADGDAFAAHSGQ